MRVAIYGGSFNPPHVGHAMVAAWLRWTGQVDRVWLVPVFRHAFEGRHDKTLAPYEQRVAWCRAMAAEIGPEVEVSEVEARLPTPSFTIDTLDHLARTRPEHRFRLVVGADVLPQLPDWRRWEEIAQRFDPILVGRQGHPSPGPDVVEFPAISSSEIRRRLAAGESVDHLLTRGVHAALRASPGTWGS